ncbi:MAG TPA: hypothetical protein VFH37_03010 [Candidatus Saccharimonadales bacterium]|nr:hypothetical protein [Candidatus Saccharimonadales bacterium]
MPARHEKQKPKKIERLHFKVEEDIAVEDEEFLNQFLGLLIENNLDPKALVFSGMDGTPFKKNRKMAPVKGIYGMNLAGWENTFTDIVHRNNPGVYAERYLHKGVPAIGLFDKNQLIEAYSHRGQEHSPNLKEPDAAIELGQISVSGRLAHRWESTEGGDVESLDDWVPAAEDIRFHETAMPEFVEEPDDFDEVDLGHQLATMPNEIPISEGVVSVNYPNGSPAEALVGIVYIERMAIKHS